MPPETPARIIYEALERHGYVKGPDDLAAIVEVSKGSMWLYLLAGPDPRRIRARPQTLHRWASGVALHTRLQISIVLPPRTNACIHVQGRDSAGDAITPYTLPSTLAPPTKIARKKVGINKKVDEPALPK